MKKRTHSVRTLFLISLALFAATWILYANTLANRFAFDDKSLVVENRFLSQGASLTQIFTTNYRAGAGFIGDGLYRPVVMLSYLLNKGDTLEPFPFHLFNVTVNALNTVLLFFLLYGITGNVLFSSLAGVLFGFHPIHTEAVANVAGRPEILCVFFLLASWIMLEKYPSRLWSLGIASVLFFAALLSKETAVVYPLMIPAADAALKRKLISRDSIIKYLILFGILSAYLILRWKILGDTAAGLDPTQMDNPIAHSPFPERTATALSVFVRYVSLLFFPVKLSADYSYDQLPIYASLFHPMPVLGIIVLAGMVAGAFLVRKHSPLPSLALILFMFPLLLVSNLLFPVGTIMGERLLYLPSAGFAIFGGMALAPMFLRKRAAMTGILGLILILFTARTVTRNREWYDDYSLFSADLKKVPRSIKVLTNLGYLTGKKGQLEESMEYFRKALEIDPDYDDALKGYGRRLYDRKQYEESANYYAKAVSIAPENPDSHTDYAIVLQKLEQNEAAERELRIAIQLNPSKPLPYQEMSSVLIAKQDYRTALTFLRQAEALGGDPRVILNNSAVAQFLSGNVTEAYRLVMQAQSRGIQINKELAGTILSQVNQNQPKLP